METGVMMKCKHSFLLACGELSWPCRQSAMTAGRSRGGIWTLARLIGRTANPDQAPSEIPGETEGSLLLGLRSLRGRATGQKADRQSPPPHGLAARERRSRQRPARLAARPAGHVPGHPALCRASDKAAFAS